MRWVIPIAILAIVLGSGGAFAFEQSVMQVVAPSFPFDYVVTVIMENEGINDTYGSHCMGNCTYITQFANQYGLAERYSSVAHTSLPNYLTLTSGGNYDRPPFDIDCYPEDLTTGCYVSGPNIIDSVETSGRTWKAYMEDHSAGGCNRSNNPSTYENSHNPFLYYTDIYNNATRCARIVNANPGASGYLALPMQLLSDLGSTTTASNYMWLTPNLCDDGHNLCAPPNNRTSQANQYLSLLIPQILNSTIFKTQNAALLVTWDESTSSTNNIVTSVWAGPVVKKAYKSSTTYDHYSGIKTVETTWGLPALYANDTSATPMSEFFAPAPPADFGGAGRRPLPMTRPTL